MTIRHVRALVFKDLRLHGKGVLAAHGGVLAMTAAAIALFEPQQIEVQGPLLGLVTNLNFLCAMLWGEWFVSREKTKGSFAWLRTLPIRAVDLCIAKFAVVGTSVTSLWAISSAVFLRGYFRSTPAIWPIELLGLLLFSAIVVASRMLFRQKLGQTLPLLLVLPIVLIALVAERYRFLGEALAFWATLGGKVVVALVLAVAYGAVCTLTIRLVGAAETRRLVE